MNDSFDINTYVEVINYPCDLQVGDILFWCDDGNKEISLMVMIVKFIKYKDSFYKHYESFAYYDLTRGPYDLGERYWFWYWRIMPVNKCTKPDCACKGGNG